MEALITTKTATIIFEKKFPYTDHDRLFKELIQTFFKEFIEAFFPLVYKEINFSTVKFLDQEVFTDITVGEKRRIDILAEVKLKGKHQIIHIHIEPQASYEKKFHERMFIYYSRLYEKHRKPILPIAVFSYNDKRQVPKQFDNYVIGLHTIRFRYLQLHLIKKNWRKFIKNDNPAAAALLSKMGYTSEERVQVKFEFLRMIGQMELDPARMSLLYGFFETYLELDDEEEKEMQEKINQLQEDEAKVLHRLPNSYFEKGMKEGIVEGIVEGIERGKQEVAKNLLLKNMSKEEVAEVTELSIEEIEKIAKNIKN
jgi:hypothetical protein